jgi:membrane peptidoglycan carboxypeptidase
MEITSAYAAFAALGHRVQPYTIREIRSADGTVLYRRPAASSPQVFTEQNALEMNDLLYQVVAEGTGHAASVPGHEVAGKTGTSADYRDAWFIGFSPNLVTGVWVGNDDNSPMNKVTGGLLPAQIWNGVMNVALQSQPDTALPRAEPVFQTPLMAQSPDQVTPQGQGPFDGLGNFFGRMFGNPQPPPPPPPQRNAQSSSQNPLFFSDRRANPEASTPSNGTTTTNDGSNTGSSSDSGNSSSVNTSGTTTNAEQQAPAVTPQPPPRPTRRAPAPPPVGQFAGPPNYGPPSPGTGDRAYGYGAPYGYGPAAPQRYRPPQGYYNPPPSPPPGWVPPPPPDMPPPPSAGPGRQPDSSAESTPDQSGPAQSSDQDGPPG